MLIPRHSTLTAEQLEDLYVLTPMQQHILAQSVVDAESYVERGSCTVSGDLDAAAFFRAWHRVIHRHPILRTSFHWEGLSKAVQAVHRAVDVPFEIIDLRRSPEAVETVSTRFAETPPSIRLTQPPLLQLQLLRGAEKIWYFNWIVHHLVHDAWSTWLTIQEVLTSYENACETSSKHPCKAQGFGVYVRWLRNYDNQADVDFWAKYLAGWSGPIGIPFRQPRAVLPAGAPRWTRLEVNLEEEHTRAAEARLRKLRITWSTLIHALWAAFLADPSDETDVSFGTAVAGRPTELGGSEEILGPFFAVLPVRIRTIQTSMREWLADAQQSVQSVNEHSQISGQRLSAIVGRVYPNPLFHSVVVIQQIVPSMFTVPSQAFTVSNVQSSGYSGMPVTLRATPGQVLRLELLLDLRSADVDEGSRALRWISDSVKAFGAEAPLLGTDNREAGHSFEGLSGKTEQRTFVKATARRPRPVRVKSDDLVSFRPLLDGTRLPILATPTLPGVDLASWLGVGGRRIDDILRCDGAVLFRGFAIPDINAFETIVKTVHPDLLDYMERSTPRTQLAGRVYSSTEYPSDQPIALHNEFSYGRTWPMRIAFYCVTPAAQGGATPIADARRVLKAVGQGVEERFRRLGVRYCRHFGLGIDLPWEEAFQTSERSVVEDYCRKAHVSFEWTVSGGLRTYQVRPAVATHPASSEDVWFNQAHLFHISNLHESVRNSMCQLFAEPDLPRNAYMGDGSQIPSDDLEAIRSAYRDCSVRFDWERGDLLLLDNMIVAHGREPYTGARKIAVAMTQPHPTASA